LTLQVDPVFDTPLLLIERTQKVLVAADIHLGMEYELWQCGVSIPSQTKRLQEMLLQKLAEIDPDRLVLLGDIKHNVPKTSWQEKQEVPAFLQSLSRQVEVDLVPGNHDGGLADLAPPGTRVQPSTGFILDGVGYFHGHTWPDAELFSCDMLVTGHIHPAVRLRDPLGHGIARPAWVRAPICTACVETHYKKKLSASEMIIVPAFNDLCGGLSLNETQENEDGPVLTMASLDQARIYLLDGTDLGDLGSIRARRIEAEDLGIDYSAEPDQ
jgi:putative SbcD/Mre11-related phosphoesterase